MDVVRQLLVLLPIVLPIIGKVLLMIPLIPNRLIPWINTAIATAAKYWVLLGFDQVETVDPEVSMAGLGALGRFGIALVWGVVDQLFAGHFYEYRKLKARTEGKQSWLEKGKKSWF